MAERRLTVVGKLLAVLAAVLLVWVGTPALCRRLEFFRVRRIEFSGMRHLEPARAVRAMGLGPTASVYDDLRPVEQRLFAIRGVRAVEVTRRLPGTLVVRLEEWPAVALAPERDGLALVDPTGRVLPFDPVRTAPDLPLVPAPDQAVARVLAQVQAHDPALFAEVNAATRVGRDVVLQVGGRRYWFGPTVSAEDIRAVTAVAQDLARQGRSYHELDGRFAGQVIVRWART